MVRRKFALHAMDKQGQRVQNPQFRALMSSVVISGVTPSLPLLFSLGTVHKLMKSIYWLLDGPDILQNSSLLISIYAGLPSITNITTLGI